MLLFLIGNQSDGEAKVTRKQGPLCIGMASASEGRDAQTKHLQGGKLHPCDMLYGPTDSFGWVTPPLGIEFVQHKKIHNTTKSPLAT